MARHIVTDYSGYSRYFESHKLVSRKVAFEQVYRRNRHRYPLPFRYYLVHHKDGDKLNNDPENLELLTREQHNKLHSSFTMNQLRSMELRRRKNKFRVKVFVLASFSALSFFLSYLLSSKTLALLGIIFGVSAVYTFFVRRTSIFS